jgi:TRAP-type uncharacterized transport system substrate-binding protein
MRLWLAQRLGRGGGAPAGRTLSKSTLSKSIESFDHIVRSRVRMFLRHTWLVTILGTVILGGGAWAAFYFTTKPTVLRVAAGPLGGVDARLVEFLAHKFTDTHDKIVLRLVTTAGPAQSATAIADEKADLAILPSVVGSTPDWPVVAIVRQNVLALIVPAAPPAAAPAAAAPAVAKQEPAAADKKEATAADKKEKTGKNAKAAKGDKSEKSDKTTKNDKAAKNDTSAKNDSAKNDSAKNDKGAKSSKTAKAEDADDSDDTAAAPAAATPAAPDALDKIPQLAGRRVGIVTGTEANADLLNLILRHYGVPLDKVAITPVEPSGLAAAVHDRQVDVIFVAGPATGHAITDAVAAATVNGQAPTFIPIGQAEGIAKRDPAFDAVDIDAGTFGGNPPMPDDSLKSLGFPEYLVANKSLDHDDVGALARLIYTSRLALAAALPGEVKIEAPKTEKDAAVIVHQGAREYLGDEQKTFFDRYGDEIFYSLLILPLFGSAIAAVASYFRHSSRTRRLRLLQRVIDLVRKAHAAPSLDALDQIQGDLDNLVIAIIHQGEHEEYDDTVQMSFSLALDQLRFAIAARRAMLLDHAGTGTDTDADATSSGSKAAAA